MRSLWFGFNPPFIAPGGQILQTQTNERLIKNDFLQLLLTTPGERVMRPGFGTGIRTSLFDPNDELLVDNLRESIIDASLRIESRIIIQELLFQPNEDQNILNIRLDCSIVNDDGSRQRFILELDTPIELVT